MDKKDEGGMADYPKTDEEIIQAAQTLANLTPTSGARTLCIPIRRYTDPVQFPKENEVLEQKYAEMSAVYFKVSGDKWVFHSLV